MDSRVDASPRILPAGPTLTPVPDRPTSRGILFVTWRDMANPLAGGSELLVDRLATALAARGHQVTLLCGGPVGERPYRVVRSGGTYTQYLRAPLSFSWSRPPCDVVVEVCNGMPFLVPLWLRRKPTICWVNHLHTDMWSLRFPSAIARFGRYMERDVMPLVHRNSLFVTISESSKEALQRVGVRPGRVRVLLNGVDIPDDVPEKSSTPLFVVLGRLAEYKRVDVVLRLWEAVRQSVGGELLIVGDGPERDRLERLAGPQVTFTGRVGDAKKHQLLSRAWLLLHPALIEGWGLVVTEAGARKTSTLAFNVPGLRDSIVDGRTGTLADDEDQFVAEWIRLSNDHGGRVALGEAARELAISFSSSRNVDVFAEIAEEAISGSYEMPNGRGSMV